MHFSPQLPNLFSRYLRTRWLKAWLAFGLSLLQTGPSLYEVAVPALSYTSRRLILLSSAVPCHPDSCLGPSGPLQYLWQGGDVAKTQWDDAENLELPLVKVWPVAADGSDQQLAMARFRHCRFLTIPADGISVAEASFLLQPKWHKPSVGDGCGRCWSLHNWWLLLSSGDNWVSFDRAVLLICLRSKHSVEDRWI